MGSPSAVDVTGATLPKGSDFALAAVDTQFVNVTVDSALPTNIPQLAPVTETSTFDVQPEIVALPFAVPTKPPTAPVAVLIVPSTVQLETVPPLSVPMSGVVRPLIVLPLPLSVPLNVAMGAVVQAWQD